jgi:hypothetical protein
MNAAGVYTGLDVPVPWPIGRAAGEAPLRDAVVTCDWVEMHPTT